MSFLSSTTDVTMINLVMTGADGVGGVWQDQVQLVPLGMNNDPVRFVTQIKAGLPLVNNLRVLFNEHSFNPDGSMHPQMEAFLAEAVAQGFDLTICYGEGDAQNIGRGYDRWPRLTNAEGYAALEENFTDISAAWQSMMDWMAAHADVAAGVYGYELINESASYRETIRYNGAGEGYSLADFVGLFADHAVALAQMIDLQAEGRILVGGWGFNGDFATLANTIIDGQSALDVLRAGVGADLVWSSHFYPGWLETGSALSPAELVAQLAAVFAPLGDDAVLITEINAHGEVNNPGQATDIGDLFAASYEWFADNGIGLGWYPGVQTGASHLLYLETNGTLTYRHQHSLAHAMNAFSLGRNPASDAASQVLDVDQISVRLRNESYEIAAGEALFDTVTKAGFAFGYAGNDTLRGADDSNDFLYGGRGNDVLTGLAGDDFLFGQQGNDGLYGGDLVDHLFGGVGHDTLDSGTGADFMAGGKHNDSYIVDDLGDTVVEYEDEGTDLVRTNLASYTLGEHVENLIYTGDAGFVGLGNALANTITGSGMADALSGLGGNDRLNGGAGNDTLTGGTGADTLSGGTGVDLASYLDAGAGVQADLTTILTAPSAGDAAGDRFISIERLQGSNFADQLSGNAGTNVLWGMAGDDILAGRGGNDLLYGGAGVDSFVFGLGDKFDRVQDFENDIDTLVFHGFAGVTTATEALAFASQSGASVVFTFGNGDVLTVLRTTLAALADDIVIL